MAIITDDIMSTTWLRDIQDVMLSDDFAWFYKPSTVKLGEEDTIFNNTTKNTKQFYHMFYANDMGGIQSNWFYLITPLIESLTKLHGNKVGRAARIKANMLLAEPDYPEGYHNPPHVDWNNSSRFDDQPMYSTVFLSLLLMVTLLFILRNIMIPLI
jgi:hypothetical protein